MSNLENDLRSVNDCYNRGDYHEAYNRYSELAKAGHSDSQVFVGWMLIEGIGTERKPDIASYWFHRSATLGSARGAFYYARLLTSWGMPLEALEWYRVAANKDYLPAIFRVGYSLVRGMGVDVNHVQGYKYLISAAKQGHVFALREIAIQDLKGFRGIVVQLTAPFLLLYSIILGLIISVKDRFSVRLLA